MSRIVIAGASGFMGRYLVDALRDAGDDVATIGRRDADAIWGDTTGIRALIDGADVVLNLAGRAVYVAGWLVVTPFMLGRLGPERFGLWSLLTVVAGIYLAFDFKADAIRFLRRALMVDPENAAVHKRLADLGIRRRPPIRFLPRGHALNRLLGRVQARMLGRTAWVLSRAQGA